MADYSAQWEYQSLWWAKQAAWQTSIPTTGFKKVQNNNKPWLVSPRPAILAAGGAGDGLPYVGQWRSGRGSPGFANQTTHWATQQVMADAFFLLFQGGTNMYTATHTYLSTHNSGGAAITWTPDPSWVYATLLAINDGGADPTSAMRATSCVPASVAVTIPTSTGGEAGGLSEVSIDWRGYEGTRDTTYTNTTPSEDTAEPWHRKDWTFKIATTAYDFTSANFTVNNGLAFKANMAGMLMGMIGITGSITLLFHADASAAPDLFLDSLDDPRNSAVLRTLSFIHNDGSKDDFVLAFPALPTGQPTRGDLGGGVSTLSFNFQLVGSSTAYPILKIDDESDFDLTDSTFYSA